MALKRQTQQLSQLDKDEWIDFASVVQNLEECLSKIFKPTLYNWSCFKNAAFRENDPHPEIHWHFIPRYKDKIEFEGFIFDDPDFGFIPQPIPHIIPDEIMTKIESIIKENL